MSLRPEEWVRVKGVFDAAVAIESSAERADYLASTCGDDVELRRQVETLLKSHERATRFLETPAAVLLDGPSLHDDLIGRTIGSYRLVERIGAGGMGVVYKAEDAKLDRPVALKLLPERVAGDPDRLRRLHDEARAASSLNHPHILVVHDVGDVDGRPFIVTEFVEGQTLRQRLEAGPIPIREAVEIGVQAAGALAAAHARGIVHRDIKPENVMVRPDGYVKVLDFGLAKLLPGRDSGEVISGRETAAGVTPGTPRYMSPEQVRGVGVDERTDVWSLGVLLYEMLAGRPPFEGATSAAVLTMILDDDVVPIVRYVPDVPPALAGVLEIAMRKDPQERYQSAASLRDALAAVAGVPARTLGRRRWIPVALPAMLVVAGVTLWLATRRPPSALTSRDTILLADIVNKTGDSVFDDTLKTALAVGLSQSPYVRILPDDAVRETLARMNRPGNARISGSVAREVCQREGAKAMIEGSIASLGSHYVISLQSTACSSGELLGRQQIEAQDRERVLTSLGAVTDTLRGRLGESLASIRQYDVPLERATTSSLEALKAYSTGTALRAERGSFGQAQAIPFFKRAIELDPDFALSYRSLATIYESGSQQNSELARQYGAAAFARRDRLTDLEQLAIANIYYVTVTGEIDKAIDICEVWKQRYPNDPAPPNNLGTYYRRLGRLEEGLEAPLESVRRNPRNVTSAQNLAVAYAALNRWTEARAVAEGLVERGQVPRGSSLVYEVAFVQGDSAAMQREADAARARPYERDVRNSEIAVLTFRGQFRKARDLAIGAPTAAELRAAALREALVGYRNEAKRVIRPALVDSTPEGRADAALALALAGELGQAEILVQSAAAASPTSTFMNRITVPTARAALELARGSLRSAVTELQRVEPYDRATAQSMPPPYIRGQALLKEGNGPAAASEFKKLIAGRGRLRVNVLFPLAHLGLGRALALAGDTTGALKAYGEFFAFWKDADADIPVLIEARKEFAALQRAGRR